MTDKLRGLDRFRALGSLLVDLADGMHNGPTTPDLKALSQRIWILGGSVLNECDQEEFDGSWATLKAVKERLAAHLPGVPGSPVKLIDKLAANNDEAGFQLHAAQKNLTDALGQLAEAREQLEQLRRQAGEDAVAHEACLAALQAFMRIPSPPLSVGIPKSHREAIEAAIADGDKALAGVRKWEQGKRGS